MKFLIMAPRFVNKTGDYYDFPVGLAYISAVLKRAGHEVHTLNLNHLPTDDVDAVVRETVRSNHFDAVCTGGLSAHYLRIKPLVEASRAASPESKIILGGGLISSEPELMVEALGIDIGVIGEGEETILELAQVLESGGSLEGVRGIVYRNPDGRIIRTAERPNIKDLDALPFPDYDGFDVSTYLSYQRTNDTIYYMNTFDRPRLLPVIASRSCPYCCTFCFHPNGNKYRRRSLDGFIKEVEHLVERYDINLLAILDELFSVDHEHMVEFCERMKPFGLKWIAQLRVDQVDRDRLSMFKDAGLFYISYGIESASDSVLKSMKKKINMAQTKKALELTRELGIGIQGNFIFGDPAETPETATQTIDWWIQHSYYHLNMGALIPYPGSDVYNLCLQRDLIKDRLAFVESGCPSLNMTAMTQSDYSRVFQIAAQAQAQHRQFCRVISVTPTCYDVQKKTRLYRLEMECPHCQKTTVYQDFHQDALEVFKIVCRHCRQRSDISSAHFGHVLKGFTSIRTALKRLADAGTPLALTPAIGEEDVREFMELLDVDIRSLNIRCVLDQDAGKDGLSFLGAPISLRTPENVRALLPDHHFLLLPCGRPEAILEHLKGICGVSPDKVLSLPRKHMQVDRSPLDPPAMASALGAIHPELAGITSNLPLTQIEACAADVAMFKALHDLHVQGITRLAVLCDILRLNPCLTAAEALGFKQVDFVSNARQNYYFAGRRGLQKAVTVPMLQDGGYQAVLILRQASVALETDAFDAMPARSDWTVCDLDMFEGTGHLENLLAADIAAKLNRARVDVVYVAEFAYVNLCKQSQSLRRKGWRTALLVVQPSNMDKNAGYFDEVVSSYRSLSVLFNALRGVDAPIFHVQGWLTYHYLPLLAKAANPSAKVVTEFNDIPQLFGEWDFLESLFGKPRTHLEKICSPLVFQHSDGLVFNTATEGASTLVQEMQTPTPYLCFHSYPEPGFFESKQIAVDHDPSPEPHLVFIGNVAPSSLPKAGWGDVQLLPMIEELMILQLRFDILLNPSQLRNDGAFADYHYLEHTNPRFRLRSGIPPHQLAADLTRYDFGVMFYRFPKGFGVGRRHFDYMLPTKFFSFIEACVPIVVSEELAYVSAIVREHGLGVVVSQSEISRLGAILAQVNTVTLRRNITAYRATVLMDEKIVKMEALYHQLLAKAPV
jgi:anaerobic magnesium-protoporphyrin IX monomethyl ester cyclase